MTIDRSMADQFFRPGFTRGTWMDGEFWKGLHYEVFVGNGLSTLTVNISKIDRHLVISGSAWWEPLGVYGIAGTRARGMYNDYPSHAETCDSSGSQLHQVQGRTVFQSATNRTRRTLGSSI